MALRNRTLGRPTPRRSRRILWLVVLIALLALGWHLFGVAPAPRIELSAGLPGIGPQTGVEVRAEEPRFGLASVELVLQQGDRQEVVAAETYRPRPLWWPWGEKTPRARLEVSVGHGVQDWLEDGEAELVARAVRHGGLLRSPPASESRLSLPVRVSPPKLAVLSRQTWVRQGGSEAVVYVVEETALRHGVEAGQLFFPGGPTVDGHSFAIFAAPWDSDDEAAIRLVAEDELGNRVSLPFVDQFRPRAPGASSIRLSDGFLEKVVPPIVAQTKGLEAGDSPLETYLEINGRLRAENRARLMELGAESVDRFLWSLPFLPFPGGQVMDSYAVRRQYRYEGETVDEQVHLGYDLASVARAEVPAANSGRVLLAGYLGIYGNVVVLDHGFGLMSLYAHLSSFAVTTGETVERGQTLGRTGATGLAGGDHLHFAMLLRGLPVDPVEWWDAHWIEDRLARKLGATLPFTEAR